MRSVVMAVSEQEEWEMQRRVGMTSWRVDSARECRQRIFKANGCSMARRKPFWHSRTCESQMECFGQILPKTLHGVECFGHDSIIDSFTSESSSFVTQDASSHETMFLFCDRARWVDFSQLFTIPYLDRSLTVGSTTLKTGSVNALLKKICQF